MPDLFPDALIATVRHSMHDDFEKQVEFWSKYLADTEDIRGWERGFLNALKELYTRSLVLGSGSADVELFYRVRELIAEQALYLSYFGDDLVSQLLDGVNISEKQVAHRSRMYAGPAIAEFYRLLESRLQDGMVIDYIAEDDEGTCIPCAQAELNSPYLPGTGPFPGEVCLGRGNCRCERVERLANMTDLRGGFPVQPKTPATPKTPTPREAASALLRQVRERLPVVLRESLYIPPKRLSPSLALAIRAEIARRLTIRKKDDEKQ